MSTQTRIAVAGATGRLGHHVVAVLEERGYEVVPMSRATGVDVITGDGLADALRGVHAIVDAATGPSPDEREATDFFTASTENLQRAGAEAGVERIIVVSIVGIDGATAGYAKAKVIHEQRHQAGPVPVRILRATQFHEFVGELMNWGRQGDVVRVPEFLTQIVAARTVAEALADLVAEPGPIRADAPILDLAGPREERLVTLARALAERRGEAVRIEETPPDPADAFAVSQAEGGMLPGPGTTLAGPTFAEWLEHEVPAPVA